MSNIAFAHPQIKFWLISATTLAPLIAAILPAFYFALYRDGGILYLPKRLRLLALLAALVTGVMLIAELPAWIGSLTKFVTALSLEWHTGAASALAIVRNPESSYQLSALLAEFAGVAQMLLLIAFFRWEGDPSIADVPVSRFLRLATKAAVISWGLIVAGAFVRLVAMPITIPQLRDAVIEAGRTPPPLSAFLGDAVRFLVSQACLFAAP